MAARAKRRTANKTKKAGKSPPRRRIAWTRWSGERLLDLRFDQLGVRLERTWIQRCIRELYDELERRDVPIRPHIWISKDFFSPAGVPGFAIPFYLTHPRLMKLERAMMLEVEGGTWDECLRILRHETGHALQHAYVLHRRSRWRQMFGSSTQKYPTHYRPNPASRRYVQHLRLYYAQSHPDEDFAETFAVWMQGRSHWKRRYSDWPAIKKLEYVDELMEELRTIRPSVRNRQSPESLRELRGTLRAYYDDKQERYIDHQPDLYDRDLKRLFSDDPKHRSRELASRFLRRNRTEIRRLISQWTGEYQFTLDQVLDDMTRRCRELRLRAVGSEKLLRINFAILLTVKAMHFLYSRRNWIAL